MERHQDTVQTSIPFPSALFADGDVVAIVQEEGWLEEGGVLRVKGDAHLLQHRQLGGFILIVDLMIVSPHELACAAAFC